MPLRIIFAGLLTAALCFGANQKLYLKDGSYQLVSQYEVKPDRIRYYSTERGDWEEIPLELVDLDRSKKELTEEKEQAAVDAKSDAEERAAEKTAQRQVASIPSEPGVYQIVSDDKLDTMKKAEVKVVSDKKRTVLKYLSPIPLVPGKSTAELDGEHAERKISAVRPEFFFRLSADEAFEIIKLAPKKGARVAENYSVLAIQKEAIVDEKVQIMPAFKKQEGDMLYRIWPQKPLEPGEYALIQYIEGKMSPQIWDFSVVEGAK